MLIYDIHTLSESNYILQESLYTLTDTLVSAHLGSVEKKGEKETESLNYNIEEIHQI
jgi:hypothetical protein